MNTRERMRASNKLVREWLLDNGYDEIWFKSHGKHNDYVFTQKGSYMAQDIWNLFDGLCFGSDSELYGLQMKTNNWANDNDISKFQKKYHIKVLSFNVTNKLKSCNGKYKVMVREY